MKRDRCPACGAAGYHGRRCSKCLYEPFMEEVAHRTHYHAGEPLVLNTRPRPVRPGQGCASYPGKRTTGKFPVKALLLVLAALLALFVPGGLIPALIIAVSLLKKKK
jgi:hypothetical protein